MPIYRSARYGSTQHSPQYHLQPLMQGHCHRASTPCSTLQDIVFNHWCKIIVPIETRARGEWSPIPDRPYRYNYANHSCWKLVHRSWRFLYSVTIRIPKVVLRSISLLTQSRMQSWWNAWEEFCVQMATSPRSYSTLQMVYSLEKGVISCGSNVDGGARHPHRFPPLFRQRSTLNAPL